MYGIIGLIILLCCGLSHWMKKTSYNAAHKCKALNASDIVYTDYNGELRTVAGNHPCIEVVKNNAYTIIDVVTHEEIYKNQNNQEHDAMLQKRLNERYLQQAKKNGDPFYQEVVVNSNASTVMIHYNVDIDTGIKFTTELVCGNFYAYTYEYRFLINFSWWESYRNDYKNHDIEDMKKYNTDICEWLLFTLRESRPDGTKHFTKQDLYDFCVKNNIVLDMEVFNE